MQFGRKHKLIRPQLLINAIADLISGTSATVILKLRTNDGEVVDAEIVKSSGSSNVDLPCQRTAYEWWFEPLKDAAGNPIPDTVLFTINFH